ncbi:MAG: phosphodiester glycosidase family protein [Gloeocapsa sp. DLM2.Bin57]|nr:MAG: phosphodiester glycosidase family protein [Gloeocapsa sp. DLM2.Bin57]
MNFSYSCLLPLAFCLALVSTLATASPQLQYQTYDLPQAVIYTLLIPHTFSGVVTVAKSPQLATVGEFATQSGAIAVLNGGYFDPQNQLSTSYLIQNGQTIADPRDNPRLINNPDLTPYLPLILNRSEFRRYQCDHNNRYDIVTRNEPIPPDCTLVDALGGGPQLLPELTAISEGFVADQDGQLVRDVLGINQPNSRTAIALTTRGDLLWIIVTQKQPKQGLSLTELADFCRGLGLKKVLNLDGGSSTSLYWDNQTYYGQISDQQERVIRTVKSVLLVK